VLGGDSPVTAAGRTASVATVLVADADQRARRLMAAALRHSGYLVESARNARQVVSLLHRRDVTAIVVDPAGLEPGDVVHDLRLRTTVPIIVVSARSDQDAKIAFLDAGADDYLSKPFGVDELLARLRAALRRAPPTAPTGTEEPLIRTNDFVVDMAARRVHRVDGTEVQLTRIEWRIVEALARRSGRVVLHTQLLEEVWGPQAREKPHYLRVHLAAIRRKLEPVPSQPRYFITYAGFGHMFTVEGVALTTRKGDRPID
jgi:two-component system KDP operon response regulator KdpE